MSAEPDQYQTASLVGGLPTCVFPPRPYARTITNIVVTNGVSSEVLVYRGSLNSVPVARNTKGDSNTITGKIALPAGQILYVQWSVAASVVSSASARVSFNKQHGPFEGDEQQWAEEDIPSIIVPSDGVTSGDPYIIISGDTTLYGATFASVAFYSPSLPPDYSIRVVIYESTSDVTAFGIQLWDENGLSLEEPFQWSYDKSTGIMAMTVGNDNITLPAAFKGTTIAARNEVQVKCNLGDVWIDAADTLRLFQLMATLNGLEIGDVGDTTPIKKDGRQLGFNKKTVTMLVPPADTETNAAFQLIAGATAMAFTKEYADTDLCIAQDHPGFSAGAGGTTAEFGLRYSGPAAGDIGVGRALYSSASVENHATGHAQVPGLPAGNYTFEPVWRRTGGLGTLTINAACGSLSYTVEEVIEP